MVSKKTLKTLAWIAGISIAGYLVYRYGFKRTASAEFVDAQQFLLSPAEYEGIRTRGSYAGAAVIAPRPRLPFVRARPRAFLVAPKTVTDKLFHDLVGLPGTL